MSDEKIDAAPAAQAPAAAPPAAAAAPAAPPAPPAASPNPQAPANVQNDIGGGTLLDPSKTPTAAPAPDAGKAPVVDPKAPDAKPDAAAEAAKAAADFPADWRQKLAGEDKKVLAKLERFGSPQDLLKSYTELQAKLDRGDFKKPLPDNATPEQLTEWRKENGVPDKVEDYKVELKDGLVIGDYEKPMVDGFLKEVAHKLNLTNAEANEQLNWYFKSLEKQTQQRFEKDTQFKEATTETLIKEWGEEYRGNLNHMRGMLDTMPAELQQEFLYARGKSGESLINNPHMAFWLNQQARIVNPVHSVVPPGTQNPGATIDAELSALQKKMGDTASDYWKGPMAERNQSRYRELVAAQERLKKQ